MWPAGPQDRKSRLFGRLQFQEREAIIVVLGRLPPSSPSGTIGASVTSAGVVGFQVLAAVDSEQWVSSVSRQSRRDEECPDPGQTNVDACRRTAMVATTQASEEQSVFRDRCAPCKRCPGEAYADHKKHGPSQVLETSGRRSPLDRLLTIKENH